MPKFHTPLRVVQLDDKRWQLETALIYSSDKLLNVIVVPAGFITDFASVPRLPFAYMLTGGKANAAAVVHDWLYSTQTVDRATADAVFREAIGAAGHSGFTAWLMWLGVRLGGWVAWDKPNLEQPPHIDLEDQQRAA